MHERIYVDGVFDLLHVGHIALFKRAKEMGKTVIVGVSGDNDIAQTKRVPILNQTMRAEMVAACRYVDEVVVPCPGFGISETFMEEHQIDMVIHGNDYSDEDVRRYYSEPKRLGKFELVEYSSTVSTSTIIHRIIDLKRIPLVDSTMTKVDCSRVYVDTSNFSTAENSFDGAFAKVDIKRGELVEKGLMRRLSDNENKAFDGMKNSFVFTWSDDKPNHTWAFASGCAAFYNSGLEQDTNTRMVRFFDEDRFEIYATRDIQAGEELTHTYKSLQWRDVFVPLYKELKKGE